MSQPKIRFQCDRQADGYKKYSILDIAKEPLSNGVFNDPKCVGSGYKIINVMDMYIDTLIDESRLNLVEIPLDEFNRNCVKTGDLFFTRSSLVKEGIACSNVYLGNSSDVTFDGHLIRLRPKKEIASPLYLHYLLKTSFVRRQLIERGKTSTMTTIGQADLETVNLYLPNLEVQDKVSNFMATFDSRIQLLESERQHLSQYKSSLVQLLLSQKLKFKNTDGKEFSKWSALSLAELENSGTVKLGRGEVISKLDLKISPGDYPVYSSSIINSGLFGMWSSFLFDEEMVTWSIDGGGNFFYRKKQKFSVTNVSGYIRFLSKDLNPYFIYLCLENHHKRLKFDYVSKAHPSVIRDLYEIELPCIEEQNVISDFVMKVEDRIRMTEQQLDLLRQYKHGLLQKLFI